ncbi:hypothetical protein M0813_22142 [Anaeramoeba flamelloides]|uniref:BTB domain-containing protein n=1 Tax=Anaeramoeba flamelloides TaxID=1746091 RepID=A0ABQ8YGM3_9EUKA|nr:hypothetical protein M0813_22142 [Anaeramoeba flamelloides]
MSIYGYGESACFIKKEFSLKKAFQPLTETKNQNIQDICTTNKSSVFQTTDGDLTEIIDDKQKQYSKNIQKIVCGAYHYLAIDESGKLYSWGKDAFEYGCLGFGKEVKEQEEMKLLEFFQNKQVVDIACGRFNSFAKVKIANDTFEWYGWGNNNYGNLGTIERGSKYDAIKLTNLQKVKRFYSCSCAHHFFAENLSGDLICWGRNEYAQLGNGNKNNLSKVHLHMEFTDIKTVEANYYSTYLLLKSGVLYMAGSKEFTFSDDTNFNSTKFQNQYILDCGLSDGTGCVLNSEGKFYIIQKNNISQIIEIELFSKNLKLFTGYKNAYYLSYLDSPISRDFFKMFKEKHFVDFKIGIYDCHKFIIKVRTNQNDVEKVKEYLESNFTENEILKFLNWCYSDKNSESEVFQSFWKHFGNIEYSKKRIEDVLSNLYQDEDSKDFSLKIPYNDEEDEEGGEEDEEEIRIHRFVLQARSGLFREMFTNVKKETNSVTDYSQKSIETMELLTKYFYTDKIELTADDDPEMVLQELSDAKEYYQLDSYSSLPTILQKIKQSYL